jgi:hypothetical protein
LTRFVRRLAVAGALLTTVSAAWTFGVNAQETPDSPELSMAKAIMRDAPTAGFAETAASSRVGSSGPVNGAAMMSPGYDALSGLSLSFVGQGYQRYWANKTAGGLIGIIGIQLPANVTPDKFLSDFENSMKALDSKAQAVKELKGAKQAAVSISGGQMHEIAFVQGNQAFVVVGTGAMVSPATVLEVSLRQQGFAGANGPAAAAAATQSADRATTNAPEFPSVDPTLASSDSTAKRFLLTWLRFGFASLIVAGVGLLVIRLARPQAIAAVQTSGNLGDVLAPTAPQTVPTAVYSNSNALNPYVSH